MRHHDSRKAAITALLVTLAAPLPVLAQAQAPGRIIGRVLDAETGRPLPGAQVAVQGSRAGALAGVDGRYIIIDVPSGEHALTVSYIGYASKTVTGVAVPAGGAANVDVALVAAAVALAEITVSAERERGTVARALDAQRTAVGVTSAVSAEQIARSADSDAAAAVKRISGVTVQDGKYVFVRGLGERYTTAALNGARLPSPEPERKIVPLDLFPAALLASITAAKTFTPNLPGDFSGAQVELRTREFPTQRQLFVSLSTGYNSAATGRLLPMAPAAGGEWLASATAPRALPPVLEHTRQPLPGRQTNEMINAMRNAWSAVDRAGRPASSLGLSLGGSSELAGQDFGYLASFSYSAADEANVEMVRENVEGDRYEGAVGRFGVLWGGLLNLSTRVGTHTRLALNSSYNRSADNEARRERGFYENHGSNVQIERLRYVERAVRSSRLQADHQLSPRQRLSWSVTSSTIERHEPDRSEFVTLLDAPVPVWYNQEGSFRAYGGLSEASLEGALDYQVELGAGRRHLLRFGGLARHTARDAQDRGYSIWTREWAPDDPRWTLRPEEFFDGRFSSNDETLFGISIYNAGGSYRAEDRLVAGYSMAELALGRGARLIGGARVERSDVVLDYEDVLGTRGTTSPRYTDLLPALALNIDLADAQKLRLSASRTLARPEYREIAPICYRAGLGEEQRCGNPDLRRTRIRNYDLRWEWYPSPTEALSIALFAKHFEDPIEPRYQGRSGTNSLWVENAKTAVNYGVELEAMRDLSFVSGALTPFSVFANATLMKSEVRTGIEGDPARRMTGQAPYVLNAGLTYRSADGASSATLLYNVVGERILNARPSGQQVSDMIERPRPMLDLALRFPLFAGIAGKLDLKNLLDSPYEARQGELQRAYYRTGRILSLGASWRR